MIHKQIDINPKLTNIPVIHLRISSLKHDPFLREFLHDTGNDISAPRTNILSDTLGLDHQTLNTCIEEFFAQIHQFRGIGCADCFESGGGCVSAGTELDAQFGLGFQFIGVDFVDETEPVVFGE